MLFFRKTGVKVIAAILCIASLTAGIVSGFLMAILLTTGCYDSTSSTELFEHMTQNLMSRNVTSIMYDYFDPNDPTHPWRSYYNSGIYTGEGSNLVYTITDDETGKTVLSTYNGKEAVFSEKEYTHSFSDQIETDIPDTYEADGPVICLGNAYFMYRSDSGLFEPLSEDVGNMLEGQTYFPVDVYEEGFTYNGTHYGFNGDSFLPYEQWQNTEVRYESHVYTITCYLRADLPYSDMYRSTYYFTKDLYSMRYWLIAITASTLILTIVLLVILGCAVGHVNGKDELVRNPIYRIPPDAALLLCILVGSLCLELCIGFSDTTYMMVVLFFDLLMLVGLSTVVVYGIMTLCIRTKTRTLISGTLIYWCIHNIGRACRWVAGLVQRLLNHLPVLWKVGVCYGVLCLIELIGLAMFFWGDNFLYFLWFVEKLLLGALIFYVTLCFRRLKVGAEHIASGNYNTKVREDHLVLDFKKTADTLNHIQDGMTAAVESRMRSERLKTELITNVSHDLKTPLTSIVSYVDLLKQEPIGSPAAGEYLEVLDRQSQRLKKLIEDLVEASKASTGNITAVKEPLDLVMLLGQALGEYSQRLMAAELTPVLHLPEMPAMILADGRLLWRVFDNLLGNIVKYAMPGTRVYISAEAGDTVTATFRNISQDALDVSADELMERFVRGDASRHTEGSGLGLSIARSLTESMGGTFQLSVDGDLFKAMVTFPLLTEYSAEPAEPEL